MKTSHRGIIAIEGREGIVLHGYKDSKGLLTVGCGHLVKAGEPYTLGGKITQDECDRLLAIDLAACEKAVNGIDVPLKQNEFDACVSLAFNIGVGGFKGSTVVKKLKAGDKSGAAQAFMRWVKPPEITGRRRTEVKQFLTPYPNSAATNSNPVTPPANSDQPNDDQEQQLPPIETAPIVQNADTIVNSGDTASPPPPSQDITMHAPVAMGSVQGSTKVTILGITIPAFLVAFCKMLGKWFEDGTLDVKNAFDTVTNLIQQNFKYILIVVGLVIVMIMLKKVERIVVFIVSMITHAMPGWNSVTVTAAVPAPPKPWYHIW